MSYRVGSQDIRCDGDGCSRICGARESGVRDCVRERWLCVIDCEDIRHYCPDCSRKTQRAPRVRALVR